LAKAPGKRRAERRKNHLPVENREGKGHEDMSRDALNKFWVLERQQPSIQFRGTEGLSHGEGGKARGEVKLQKRKVRKTCPIRGGRVSGPKENKKKGGEGKLCQRRQ